MSWTSRPTLSALVTNARPPGTLGGETPLDFFRTPHRAETPIEPGLVGRFAGGRGESQPLP